MVEKEQLTEEEIADITKEAEKEVTEVIGVKEDDGEIEGKVIRELISPRYEEKNSYNIDNKNISNKLEDKKTLMKRKGKRRTPPIDGEEFDVKRSYLMRRSTVRMVNQLIGMSEDIDIHINTIVDRAIRDYYFRALEKEKENIG